MISAIGATPSNNEAFALLLLLGRPVLSATLRARAEQDSGRLKAEDWAQFVEAARSRRVAPWVLKHVRDLKLRLPPDSAAELARASLEMVMHTTAADALLNRIEPLMAGEDAPAMLIKGASIEARAYPTGTARPQLDVDLLVRPGRWHAVEQWLIARGFSGFFATRSGHELGMRDDPSTFIELHRTLLCPFRFAPFTRPATSERLFARGQLDPDGRLTIGDVDQTALLLVHLLEDAFVDVRHIADAARWLRSVPVRPDAAWAEVERWQARRAAAAGLRAIRAHDPGAVGPEWLALERTAPRGPQEWVAGAFRRAALTAVSDAGRAHARYIEGLGLMAHLDRPWRWAFSYVVPRAVGATSVPRTWESAP